MKKIKQELSLEAERSGNWEEYDKLSEKILDKHRELSMAQLKLQCAAC
ncbi:hypothetical protein KAU09_02360 [Candidatus Parcubacteria bacterium]|nr:hypothetical protein [Candidatus Parcubacteria bacterium]